MWNAMFCPRTPRFGAPGTKVHARVLSIAALALLLVPAAVAQHFNRTDLTRDPGNVVSTAPNVDPNLVNSWGLARGTGTFWWIADNGTGLATTYDAAGVPQAIVVTIPPPPAKTGLLRRPGQYSTSRHPVPRRLFC